MSRSTTLFRKDGGEGSSADLFCGVKMVRRRAMTQFANMAKCRARQRTLRELELKITSPNHASAGADSAKAQCSSMHGSMCAVAFPSSNASSISYSMALAIV